MISRRPPPPSPLPSGNSAALATTDPPPQHQAEQDALRGLLLVVASSLLLFPAVSAHPAQRWIAPLAALAVLLTTFLLPSSPRLGRALASTSILTTVGVWLAGAGDDPVTALLLIVVTIALLARIHPPRRLLVWQSLPTPILSVRPAAWLALAVSVGAWFRPWEGHIIASGSLVFAALLPGALSVQAARRHSLPHRVGLAVTLLGLLLGALHLALRSDVVLRVLPVLPALVLLGSYRPDNDDDKPIETFVGHPPRLLVLSFLALCSLGTLLLALPGAEASGRGLPLVDALFTAVSASCVTGLSVIDVSQTLSWWGQGILLVLMQAGGLGIMTFAAAAFALLGRRFGVREERSAVGLLGASDRSDLQGALRRVLIVTASAELLGAVALTLLFHHHGDPWPMAAWRGLFTAVSAFCNAGFTLQTHSLVPYQTSLPLLLVVGTLITLGGLGPAVIYAVAQRRRGRRLGLHARLVLVTSLLLSGGATVGFAAFEWNGDLAHLTPEFRMINAAFQAISFRTAGFHSVDLPSMHHATWVMVLIIMFIGGSPGSAAGGVKTTTVSVLILEVLATIRGRRQVEAFGRRLPTDVLRKALAVVIMGLFSFLLLLLAIQLTQRMALDVAIFEAMSAIATVGASMGGTDELDTLGKLIICGAMFVGRVGPLTLLLLLQDDDEPQGPSSLPQEAVPVG